MVDKNLLYRYTYLTGMIKASFYQCRNGLFKIRVFFDNDRCDTAMLQGASGTGSEFGFQLPTYLCRTDKGQVINSRVSSQLLREIGGTDQALTPSIRQPSFF